MTENKRSWLQLALDLVCESKEAKVTCRLAVVRRIKNSFFNFFNGNHPYQLLHWLNSLTNCQIRYNQHSSWARDVPRCWWHDAVNFFTVSSAEFRTRLHVIRQVGLIISHIRLVVFVLHLRSTATGSHLVGQFLANLFCLCQHRQV